MEVERGKLIVDVTDIKFNDGTGTFDCMAEFKCLGRIQFDGKEMLVEIDGTQAGSAIGRATYRFKIRQPPQ